MQGQMYDIKASLMSLSSQMHTIVEKQDSLLDMKKELSDLRSDFCRELGAVSSDVKEAAALIAKHDQKLCAVEKKLDEEKARLDSLEERQIDQEARSRRCNLLFLGLPEESREIADQKFPAS